MNIRFGSNEYELIPGSGILELTDSLEIQLLADPIDIDNLEEVLSNKTNLETIKVVNQGSVQQIFKGYTKVDSLIKKYDVVYSTTWAEDGSAVESTANILYVYLKKPGLEEQVEENTANIEFLAIMSDIEL